MGRLSKNRGKAYEERVKRWFLEREWNAKRIILSGACASLGRMDVHAWLGDVYLTIEAKKRGQTQKGNDSELEIKKVWTDHINFSEDEILVFATLRSDHYCMIPTERFFQILDRSFEINYDKSNTFKGKNSILI